MNRLVWLHLEKNTFLVHILCTFSLSFYRCIDFAINATLSGIERNRMIYRKSEIDEYIKMQKCIDKILPECGSESTLHSSFFFYSLIFAGFPMSFFCSHPIKN